MAADDEQIIQNRRRRITSGSDTNAPLYGRSDPMTGGDDYQNQTGDYQLDQGILETRRPHSSVVRLDTGSQLPRKTNVQPVTQRRGGTREFPLNRSTGQTGQTGIRQPRVNSQQPPLRPERKEPEQPRKVHWLLPAGVGMVAMLVLWVVGSSVLAWGMQRYNDYRYGTPRTYQIDQVVGHGGDSAAHPSHFIAINLNHQAVVIELMAGDPGKSVSYVAPVYIVGDDGLAPITVDFKDVNADSKADMIVTIHLTNQNQVYVFINDGTKFRPSNANDKMHL
jgi:hypothetical protein